MVSPFKARLIKPTRLAHPGMFFQGHGLWLDSGNEKTHGYLNPDKPAIGGQAGTGKGSRKGAKTQRKPTIYSQQTWSQPSVNVIRRINNDLRNFILSHSFLSLRLRAFA